MRVVRLCPLLILIIVGGFLFVPGAAAQQTSYNRFTSKLTRLLVLDFEEGNLDWVTDPAYLSNASITSNAAEVLSGNYSLKLSKAGGLLRVPTSKLILDPGKTYAVEFKYRVLSQDDGASAGATFMDSQSAYVGFFPVPGTDYQMTGLGYAGLVVNSQGISVALYSVAADIVIDDVVIYRQDTDVSLAHVPLWNLAFPRLANFMTENPAEIAMFGNVPETSIEQGVAQYDAITGMTLDYTIGDGTWASRLQALNPNLKILGYHESFVAQDLPTPLIGGTSNLKAVFNSGVDDKWFMKRPDGTRLNEPTYPGNYQLNHTRYAPLVNGRSFIDYLVDFVSNELLPGGWYGGVHFDQPEWIVNPLFNPKGSPDPIPPIDLDGDGVAEPLPTLYSAWYTAFFDYFQKVTDKLGYVQMLLGNPGYMSANAPAHAMLNGWTNEVTTPYAILPNGDWDTSMASGWYRLFHHYWLADTVGRAPQMAFIESTGMGLGQQTGGYTANTWPQRVQQIEPRDYQRMRLGLTTALLGNGFFEYDLVDNTSIPVWFDEYAVNATGAATGTTAGKGYLGQPLGAPAELDYVYRTMANIDFESPLDQSVVHLNTAGRFTTDPNEVVSGTASLVVTRTDPGSDDTIIFSTVPSETPLVPGRTYQLFMDYKLLSTPSATFNGPLAIGLFPLSQGLPVNAAANLWQADSSGPGMRGTLRSSVRASGASDFAAVGMLTDVGSVAVDNIRLVEGTGGVWRRDFENGIVLVNPTPEAISVSLQQIQGRLGRKNIRRIRGNQVPAWNTGEAVLGSITIPPADGIILLADRVAYTNMAAPTNVAVWPSASGALIAWQGVPQYVAGYHILYGEDPNGLFQEAAAPRDQQLLELRNLHPGATYFFKVAAFDFTGRIGAYSTFATATTLGGSTRPWFIVTSPAGAIVPGQVVTLEGPDLSQVSVFMNGIPAPILSGTLTKVTAEVPWEVVGNKAVIRVMKPDGTYTDTVVNLVAVAPQSFNLVSAWHASGGFDSAPSALSRGDTAVFAAVGLGRVEPPPQDGALPTRTSTVVADVSVNIAGIPCTATSTLAQDRLGQYNVTVTIPSGVPLGLQSVQIVAGGVVSEAPVTFQ
jgi:uncharacterized protein (TIGR03437 family)